MKVLLLIKTPSFVFVNGGVCIFVITLCLSGDLAWLKLPRSLNLNVADANEMFVDVFFHISTAERIESTRHCAS